MNFPVAPQSTRDIMHFFSAVSVVSISTFNFSEVGFSFIAAITNFLGSQSGGQRSLRYLHVLDFHFNVICIFYVQDIKVVIWGQWRHVIHSLSGRKSGDGISSTIDGQSSAGTTSHFMSLVSNSSWSSSIVSAHMSNCRGQSGTLWPALPQQ